MILYGPAHPCADPHGRTQFLYHRRHRGGRRGQVALIQHIGCHRHDGLPVGARNRVGAGGNVDGRDIAQRDQLPGRRKQIDIQDVVPAGTTAFRQLHANIGLVPFTPERRRHVAVEQEAHGRCDLRRAQPQVGRPSPVHIQLDFRTTRRIAHVDIGQPRHGRQLVGDLFGLLPQYVIVAAIDPDHLDRQIAGRTGHRTGSRTRREEDLRHVCQRPAQVRDHVGGGNITGEVILERDGKRGLFRRALTADTGHDILDRRVFAQNLLDLGRLDCGCPQRRTAGQRHRDVELGHFGLR